MLDWQNKNLLNSRNWRVYSRQQAKHGLRLICGVPAEALCELHKRNGKVHFRVGQAECDLPEMPTENSSETLSEATPMEIEAEQTVEPGSTTLLVDFSNLELSKPGDTKPDDTPQSSEQAPGEDTLPAQPQVVPKTLTESQPISGRDRVNPRSADERPIRPSSSIHRKAFTSATVDETKDGN